MAPQKAFKEKLGVLTNLSNSTMICHKLQELNSSGNLCSNGIHSIIFFGLSYAGHLKNSYIFLFSFQKNVITSCVL